MTFDEAVDIAGTALRDPTLKLHPTVKIIGRKAFSNSAQSIEQWRERSLQIATRAEIENLVTRVVRGLNEMPMPFYVHEPPIPLPGLGVRTESISNGDLVLEVIGTFDSNRLTDVVAVRLWYSLSVA